MPPRHRASVPTCTLTGAPGRDVSVLDPAVAVVELPRRPVGADRGERDRRVGALGDRLVPAEAVELGRGVARGRSRSPGTSGRFFAYCTVSAITAAFDAAYGIAGTGNSSCPGVVSQRGEADARGDVDDDGVRRRAQQRERRLGHPDDADDVGVEHGRPSRSASRSSTPNEVPRIPALFTRTSSSGSRRDRGVDAGLVGDVELDDVGAECAGVVAGGGVAHAGVDGVAGLDQAAGGLESEAAVGPGDECRGHVPSLRPAPRPPRHRSTVGPRSTTPDRSARGDDGDMSEFANVLRSWRDRVTPGGGRPARRRRPPDARASAARSSPRSPA